MFLGELSFELDRDIIGANLLTKFHEDQTINVAPRVFSNKCGRTDHGRTDHGWTDDGQRPVIKTHLSNQLSSDNHLVDGPTDRPTDMSKAIYPLFFEGGHNEKLEILGGNVKLVREINKTNAKNATSIVFDHKENCPPPGGYFHDDWAKNVTSRKTAPPPPGSHETNVLTKFHENWDKYVTSGVFTFFHYLHIEKNAPPTGGHKTAPTPGSHETNVLTKFHENWDKNVTSRVFTFFHYIHIEKNAPPTGGHVFHRSGPFSNSSEISIKPMKTAPPTGDHVFQRTRTTFELNQHIIKIKILTNFELDRDIIGTNLLTKFQEDRTKNVASRVFTRKTSPPTGGHVYQQTRTTFELNQHIIKTNILTNFKLDQDFIGTKLLTKFHEDRKINVASRVFTNKCGQTDRRRTKTGHKSSPEQSGTLESLVLTRKNAPPPGAHVFQPTKTIFEIVQDIIAANLLTNHVFQGTGTIYKLVQDIITTIRLTMFHVNRTINVASISRKNAPPPGGHVFQQTITIFELTQDSIRIIVLTKYHED
ncbi:hypothetical protein DPMN_167937 [Dreissena polymorpha]|uniref:Uncharacterized protein n=1 Tax=Dreissena polymorpha TaxID=45954 RepID=A0A9D4F1R4_DREPO|nr:hypothetical protein DPMN_167937 [Dreissena polymorpha]